MKSISPTAQMREYRMVKQISRLRAKFNLHGYTQTRALGKLEHAVMLDTTEILYLHQQRNGMGFSIHLLGASTITPFALLDENLSAAQALYWMPQYALKLSQSWTGDNWPDPKRLTADLISWATDSAHNLS